MKPKSIVPLFIVALAVAVVGALVWHRTPTTQPAPAVSYTLLDGSARQLDQLRGKVVLVNFWATTCVTCVKKMPDLVATHQRYNARGLETLAVSMHHDAPARVAQFAESRRLPFGVAIDNTGQIAQAFGGIEFTPTTLLINRRGEIVRRWVGEPSFAALHALVEELLAES
jgi:peroxiredoxin